MQMISRWHFIVLLIGVLGIFNMCSTSAVHSDLMTDRSQIEALIDRIKEQLELPLGQWNISKSDVDGCMKLCIRKVARIRFVAFYLMCNFFLMTP